MNVIYQSSNFCPTQIETIYARKSVDGEYFVDDVNNRKLTIRTTKVSPKVLPEAVVAQCDALVGQAFNSVRFKW